MKVAGEYFYGNKISDYGIQNGYVDYETLAKAFGHVMQNNVVEWFDFEQISGDPEAEVFQWFIVDERGAELLREIDEVVLHAWEQDLYVWGVTHYGTAWDYVLTNIRCNAGWEEDSDE